MYVVIIIIIIIILLLLCLSVYQQAVSCTFNLIFKTSIGENLLLVK